MAGRFYFVPVDEGLDRLSAGLARGIYGATGQYERMRERQRRQPIEDLERALLEARAAEAGIRRGPRPTRTIEPPPTDFDFEMPDFRRGPLFPDTDAGLGIRLPPGREDDTGLGLARRPLLDPTSWMRERPRIEAPEAARRVEIPDPDTIPLFGDFWMEAPESRIRRRAELDRELRDEEIADLAALLDDDAAAGEISPRVAARIPGLIDRYFRSRNIGGPYEPVRGTQEWLDALEDELKLRAKYEGEGGGITPTSRYTQNALLARRFLDEIAAIDAWEPKPGEKPEDFRRAQEEARERLREVYQMDEDLAHELIRYGPDVLDEWITPPRLLEGGEAEAESTPSRRRRARGTKDDPIDLPPVRAGRPRSERTRSEEPLSDEKAAQIRAELRGLSRAEQEDILREVGLSDQQIEQVLGRRERGPSSSILDAILNRR